MDRFFLGVAAGSFIVCVVSLIAVPPTKHKLKWYQYFKELAVVSCIITCLCVIVAILTER